ncbi:uncharacterized protein DSM5745_09751 [Aspergillus mulundensis]|uniref:Protein kinase domain-containing protein n=1 Tax=Aspergillus mulundensis TaxID=1810919 RepID=A0A3D8QRR8_9EURO|nr:Uncharacterized protein DSM5745_09751 [Aspergillus mulundensis]RDW64340.1 Uncharacterized protein DSM5745_09751 [Aspergillus mulundensis]
MSSINPSSNDLDTDASTIFEVDINGKKYATKVYHDNGDPGYSKKGRDLNRFRCEVNAYKNLSAAGVCERGFVPRFYGVIKCIDPALFKPALNHFICDKFHSSAILLEYLPNAESLNCVDFDDALYPQAMEGMKEIQKAGVIHKDVYPKNILLVRDETESKSNRMVWIDFDVSTTFTELGEKNLRFCNHKIQLVEQFGEALKEEQEEGLPPNTKYY